MKPVRSKQLRKAVAKSRSGSLNQDPVEVFCRIRPLRNGTEPCLRVLSESTVQFSPPEGAITYRNGNNYKEVQYTFKQVFEDTSTQKDVYDKVAHHLVNQLIAGKNGLLFTYGVTGSGKTYTMTGQPQNPGIMPRSLEILFKAIGNFQAKKYVLKPDKMNGFEIQGEVEAAIAARNEMLGFMQPKTPKTPRRREADGEVFFCRDMNDMQVVSVDDDNKFACFVTYIEIYNNSVFDLLDPSEECITRKLQNKVIREDGNRNMYVHGVTEVEVKSPEEAFEVFSCGQKRRRVAHTMLNEESSRSHSVFTIRLVQAPLDDIVDDALLIRKLMTISQLSLVDLAGSERTNRTKNTGQRLREAGSINNSLMTLRTCLEILRENQQSGGNKMVPYRDSKLTHLFKNYFDGEGAVRMIVCVNPGVEDYDETAHVLKFAELTQEVQVTRPTPLKIEVGVTPSRRRAQLFPRDEEFCETIPVVPHFPLLATWPSLLMIGHNDEETLRTLENHLLQRESARNTCITEFKKAEETLRREIMSLESDYLSVKQDSIGLKGLLDIERKKNADCDSKLANYNSEKYELIQKLNDRDQIIRTLQSKIEDKDLIINQQGIEKEKVKEKCQTKLQLRDKKMRREMQMKICQKKEEFEEEIRRKDEKLRHIKECLSETPAVTPRYRRADCALTPRSVNTAGTLYQPPTCPSSRGPAVSNPRHRRSRSTGATERWLDHRPTQPVELQTVFQPNMRKRKSITKLTDMKDVVNPKTSKYCLTTQEQDTDGELETKLYKVEELCGSLNLVIFCSLDLKDACPRHIVHIFHTSPIRKIIWVVNFHLKEGFTSNPFDKNEGDVIPTCTGGAQVVLNDVETLKQCSPTSTPLRKRSVPDENTDARCRIALEGHYKRPRS